MMKKILGFCFLVLVILMNSCGNDVCPENAHIFDEGKLNEEQTKITYTCTVCGYSFKKETCEHLWDQGVTENDGDYKKYTCTICGKINLERIEYTCDHKWKEPIIDGNSIIYYCKQCEETRTEYETDNQMMLKDIAGDIVKKEYYYANRLNNKYVSSRLNVKQSALFEEQFQKMMDCQMVETTWCNCFTKLRVGFNYKLNDVIYSFQMSYHNHGIIVHYKNYFYHLKPNDDTIISFFEEMYSWFGITDDNIIYPEYDSISDGKLEYLHKNYDGYPEDFGFENCMGQYGRIINSCSSKEEVLSLVKNKFTNGYYRTYNVELAEETKYYYAVKVIWGPTAENYEQSYEEIVVSFKKDVYDHENHKFLIKDKKGIKKILDYLVYDDIYKIGGYDVIYTNIQEFNDYYQYVSYQIKTTYGDFDVEDHIRYYRYVTNVNKKTGEWETLYEQLINEIYIAGIGVNVGSSNEEGLIKNPIVLDVTDYVIESDIDLLTPIKIDLKTFKQQYNYPFFPLLWEEYFTGILIMYQETVDNEYEYCYPVYRNLSVTNQTLNMERILYFNPLSNNDTETTITHIELIIVPKTWLNVNVDYQDINVKTMYFKK